MFKKIRNNKIKKFKSKSKINLEGIPASNRRMEYYKKKRSQKRIKSTIFKAHSLIRFLLIIFILWISSKLMIAHYWYLPQNTFDKYPNNNLKIIGNKITPNDKILGALKSIPFQNKPIYWINTIPYEKEIEKLSPVKKAFVRRYWLPARFEVTIEEEIPAITISPNPDAPEIAAITLDGDIISKEYLPIEDKKYKTYKILTYDDYKTWSKHEILFLQILSQRIEDYSGENLVYLDIRNKKDVYAQLETTKVRIGELNSTLKDRIERLSSIMSEIENLKRQTDYIDIRWDNATFLKQKSKQKIPVVTTTTGSNANKTTNVNANQPKSSTNSVPQNSTKPQQNNVKPLQQVKTSSDAPPPAPKVKVNIVEP